MLTEYLLGWRKTTGLSLKERNHVKLCDPLKVLFGMLEGARGQNGSWSKSHRGS